MLLRPAILALALPLLAADAPPPTLRLPDSAKPLRYALELTVLPEKETFDGAVDIEVQVKASTAVLWLNASGLAIQEATYTPEGGAVLKAKARQEGEDFLGLAFDRPVPTGRGRIHLRYSGPMSRKSTHGLFTQNEGDHWYAYSQFESTYARQAFPCFDEPGFKVPWQVTLRVPKGDMALSNTPVVSERLGKDGLRTVRFAPTKPLPSYLVALGVGPFDVVNAGKAGRKATPIRIIVPKGHKAEAAYAAACTPKLFTLLENYFGMPYPYEKLDNLVIPQTVSFGAMENPGLITYAQSVLLRKPDDLSIGFKRGCADTAAHEMAHLWFGDLVTMAWWDDLWLNEAFASWMAGKITNEWKPEWDGDVSRVQGRGWAMGSDSLLSARMIRQPITSKDDIENAFDGITYTKGSAVLSMFESYMGQEKFRRGVRQYLKKHAFGNATTQNFLAALGAQGDAKIPGAFSTFLDQAGVPFLSAELKPTASGSTLQLSQRRFLPTGSKAPGVQTWQVPVTLRYSLHGKIAEQRLLMDSAHTELTIPANPNDLDYLLLNQGMTGYFRTINRGDLLARLLKDDQALSIPERIGVLGDVSAAVQAGEMDKGEALALVPKYAADPNTHIATAMAGIAWSVDDHLILDEFRPNYARFIQKYFGGRARALGFLPKPGEDENTKLLRPNLLGLVGSGAQDAELRAEAQSLTLKWLADRTSVDPNVIGLALGLAAESGDKDLFDRVLAAAKGTQDQGDRRRLLGTLGSFSDPSLHQAALAEVLTDDFDPRMAVSIMWAGLGNRATRQSVYDFMKKNFDAIMAKQPKESGAYMPFMASGFSDAAHRADVEAFFKDRVAQYPGASRNLAQVLEGISLQEASRAAQQASVTTFISKY